MANNHQDYHKLLHPIPARERASVVIVEIQPRYRYGSSIVNSALAGKFLATVEAPVPILGFFCSLLFIFIKANMNRNDIFYFLLTIRCHSTKGFEEVTTLHGKFQNPTRFLGNVNREKKEVIKYFDAFYKNVIKPPD